MKTNWCEAKISSDFPKQSNCSSGSFLCGNVLSSDTTLNCHLLPGVFVLCFKAFIVENVIVHARP